VGVLPGETRLAEMIQRSEQRGWWGNNCSPYPQSLKWLPPPSSLDFLSSYPLAVSFASFLFFFLGVVGRKVLWRLTHRHLLMGRTRRRFPQQRHLSPEPLSEQNLSVYVYV